MNLDSEIISHQDELLILVDREDNELGFASKAECHFGTGLLHRAFSVFIFNSSGQVLLQQRSQQKKLWNLYWSNSCCSHPHQGEQIENAAHRRLIEELSIDCELHYLYKFFYQESFEKKGSEHELCSVFVGLFDGEISINTNEIADWKFIDPEELSKSIDQYPEKYTPWLQSEWSELTNNYLGSINQALGLSLN
ncbi:MAG: isopentenyl-diphosphate delta-isomerase [Gammaproteobacteria bacterium]|nr:isopentenyl-diphosphate delta-isomerase [Gammaproteobacteria bacterium]|tara:strand:- start:59 stop:640 length:582 start_codon:yes stop_codon:yes gene_type:complete